MELSGNPFPKVSSGHTPSAVWLACAACGPLSEAHAYEAGLALRDEGGVLLVRRCYEVVTHIPFPALRRWVEASADVQALVDKLESVRLRAAGKRAARLSHRELAGSARASLLRGRVRAFQNRYRQYVQTQPYQWHPDLRHDRFWDEVLGPGWEGAQAVPPGEARDELLRLICCSHAFVAFPADAVRGRGACGAPADCEMLEIAACLREANAAALGPLCERGSRLALAARALLAGHWAEARGGFEHSFGRVAENRYVLEQQQAMPLLTYALLAVVLTGGNLSYLRAWMEYVRSMAQKQFPPSMVAEQADYMCFLDNLEKLDAILNRNGVMVEPPLFHAALSRLPFALAYAALPARVRRLLKADELADAVLALSHAGLHLLARYGAAGLYPAGNLSTQRLRSLEALLEGVDAATLPPLACPAAECAYQELEAIVNRSRKDSSLLVPCKTPPPVLEASLSPEGMLLELDEWQASPGRAIPAAYRCIRKYATQGRLLLVGATAAGFSRLCLAMLPEIEITGSLLHPGDSTVAAEPQVVLVLAHLQGGHCVAALRLRLMPGNSLLVVAGRGLQRLVLEGEDGTPVALERDFEAEQALVHQTLHALQQRGLAGVEGLASGCMDIRSFAALAQLLRCCRELRLETCWEKDSALRLYQPEGGLRLHPGKGAGAWLELGGGLPVDEGKVIELSALLAAYRKRQEGAEVLCLGAGEYVLLHPALERQLALLELAGAGKRGRGRVSAAVLPLLEALEKAQTAPLALDGGGTPAPLPAGLQATLRSYQLEGYCWLVERAALGLGAILADDMGLGKTLQVLTLLLHAAQQKGATASLVLAPVSLLGNWAGEAARFAPSLRLITYDSKRPGCLESLRAGDLVLASYGQLAARPELFRDYRWQLLVLDEAQTIKNPSSLRARAACSLTAYARLCLTGTPIENSLADLWSEMEFLNPGLLGERAFFLRRFAHAGEKERALLRRALAPLVLRRSKADVLPQLPPLTESVEWVDFTREERALYESLRRQAVNKLKQGGTKGVAGGEEGGIGILAELTRLRRACCHGKLALHAFAGHSSKLKALVQRVEELRAAGRQALVFSQFTDVLDLAQEALVAQGLACLRLDGSTPSRQRSALVKRFQQGGADAFLISLKAGGTGLNLTAADYVILLDPWWNPAVEAQAAGRSHRLGQRQPVTLCRLIVRGTVEERILELHREKRVLAESILSGTAKGLGLAELRALLGN